MSSSPPPPPKKMISYVLMFFITLHFITLLKIKYNASLLTLTAGEPTTVGIRKPDTSGFQMVQSSSVHKWSGFRMVQKQDGCQIISLDRLTYKEKSVYILIYWSRLVNHSKTGHFSPVFKWFTSLDHFIYKEK